MRFTLAASSYFSLWISVADIVNCFQNTIRYPKDKIFMCLQPYYLEWIDFTYPNDRVTLNKVRIVVQLFNVCQCSIDAGRLWNQHFDTVPEKIGLNSLMRDLVVMLEK